MTAKEFLDNQGLQNFETFGRKSVERLMEDYAEQERHRAFTHSRQTILVAERGVGVRKNRFEDFTDYSKQNPLK